MWYGFCRMGDLLFLRFCCDVGVGFELVGGVLV